MCSFDLGSLFSYLKETENLSEAHLTNLQQQEAEERKPWKNRRIKNWEEGQKKGKNKVFSNCSMDWLIALMMDQH